MIPNKINEWLRLILSLLGGGAVVAFVALIRSVYGQKEKNVIDAVANKEEKIDLETSSAPIDDLVANSNKEHGASAVVSDTGDGSQK